MNLESEKEDPLCPQSRLQGTFGSFFFFCNPLSIYFLIWMLYFFVLAVPPLRPTQTETLRRLLGYFTLEFLFGFKSYCALCVRHESDDFPISFSLLDPLKTCILYPLPMQEGVSGVTTEESSSNCPSSSPGSTPDLANRWVLQVVLK